MLFVKPLSCKEHTQIQKLLHNPKDAKLYQRAQIIRLSAQGKAIQEIAEILLLSEATIRRRIHKWHSLGIRGLKDLSRSGRPPKIDKTYRKVLEQDVKKNPRELGYKFNLWSAERLIRHMQKKQGVSISGRYLLMLLNQMDIVYRRPKLDLKHKQDPYVYEKKKAELERLKKGL